MRYRTGALLAALAVGPAAHAQRPTDLRELAFVANAEEATISILDVLTRRVIATLDVNPAKETVERTGAPNFAQDSDVSPDGRRLYVSRGYLADVAAFDIASGAVLWKRKLEGFRADHMVLTPDGASLFVSALSANKVVRLNAETGEPTGEVVTGVYPHDNQLSKDGTLVFNASLGAMGTPLAQRDNVAAPNERSGYAYQLTVLDAASLQVRDRIRMAAGIRPFHLTPQGAGFYAQQSNGHSVMAYDLNRRAVTKTLELPVAPGVTPADWDFEAPHHGLALTEDGKILCLAGRASDYAALVSAPDLTLLETVPVGDGPSWAELADAGRLCLVPNTRSGDVSFVSVPNRREIARVKVGKGPKHITVAKIPLAVVRQVENRAA